MFEMQHMRVRMPGAQENARIQVDQRRTTLGVRFRFPPSQGQRSVSDAFIRSTGVFIHYEQNLKLRGFGDSR